MEDLGFKSILNRKELFDLSQVKKENAQINLNAEIIEIDNEQKFHEMLKCLNSSFAVSTDEMTMRLATEDKEFVLFTSGEIFNMNIDLIQNLFVKDNQKICFDAKSLMHELSHYGIEINNYFDVSLAIYVANEMDAEISLDDALKLNNIVTHFAREIKDFQTLILVFVVQILQSLILWSKSAPGSSIHYQDHLPLILCHRYFPALGVTYLEVIYTHNI